MVWMAILFYIAESLKIIIKLMKTNENYINSICYNHIHIHIHSQQFVVTLFTNEYLDFRRTRY